jgi:hypothetical protein
MVTPLSQMRNQTRVLRSLAARLEVAIDRLSIADIIALGQNVTVESMLREAEVLLAQLLEEARARALGSPESDPQTLRPL